MQPDILSMHADQYVIVHFLDSSCLSFEYLLNLFLPTVIGRAHRNVFQTCESLSLHYFHATIAMVTWVGPFGENAWVQLSVPKFTGIPELALGPRPPDTTLTRWLYDELRRAMLTGRLKRGMRLPGTRDFAGQHGISRRVVVNVFEQLQTEGYLVSRVGSGTRVSDQLPEDLLQFAPARS